MLKSEPKVTSTSGVSSAVICKIQNMPWLKRDSTIKSTDPKPRRGTEDRMIKTLPQKDKDGQYASEKKEKRSNRRKSKRPNVDGPKNRQPRKTEALAVPECSLTMGQGVSAWSQAGNAAESLFPNRGVEPLMTEETEEEMIKRAISESLETALLEQCVIDDISQEKAPESSIRMEDEDAWGNIQRNLPTAEHENDRISSDANNNSGLRPIENLTVPTAKLERRAWSTSSRQEDNKNHGRSSELLPTAESALRDKPLVPTVVPHFIDKYGRVDGCSEKRMFMGKGARFKEQEYLKQQQMQQLESTNGSKEAHVSSQDSAASSRDSAEPPKAVSQDFSQSADGCFSGHSNQPTQFTNAFREFVPGQPFMTAFRKLPDSSETKQSRSQECIQLEKQFTSVLEESPRPEDFTQLSKQETSESQQVSPSNDYALPTSVPEQGSSEASAYSANHSTNISEKSRDYSQNYSGSQTTQVTNTPEQTAAPSHQDSGHGGRPIQPGGNSNNSQQQTRYSNSGHSANRGGYHSGGYGRGSRLEQNSGNNYGRPNREFHSGQKGHRYPNKTQEENYCESYRDVRHEQNPHKYGQSNRDAQRGSRTGQSFNKYDGEHSRDGQRGPRNDQNFHKHGGEQKRDVNKGSRSDRNSNKNSGEQNRDTYRGPAAEQSRDLPRGPTAEQNRDMYRGPGAEQSRDIPTGPTAEQNRNIHRGPTDERNAGKPEEESAKVSLMDDLKNENDHKENIPHVPFQSSSTPAAVLPEESPVQVAEIAEPESQKIIAHPVTQSETTEFHGSNIGATDFKSDNTVLERELNIPEMDLRYPPSCQIQDFHGSNIGVTDLKSESFVSERDKAFEISGMNLRFASSCQIQDSPLEMTPQVMPTNRYFVAPPPYYHDTNEAACRKDELPQPLSHYSAPPGFHSLDRPALPSCSNCAPAAPFEVRHAHLRLTDPLLYNLLLQKQERSVYSPPKQLPEKLVEPPANPKPQACCPNCSIQLPPIATEATISNPVSIDDLQRYQMLFRSIPLPMNQGFSCPVSVQYAETMNQQLLDNPEYYAANMQHPNIPFRENAGFLPCGVNPANSANIRPYFPMSHLYSNVPPPMNALPIGSDCVPHFPSGYQTAEYQRQVRMVMPRPFEPNYQMAYGRHGEQIPPTMFPQHGPLPPQLHADGTAIGRSNVAQGNPDVQHGAGNQHSAEKGVYRSIEETEQGFQSATGVGRFPKCTPIPSVGRSRGRLPSLPPNN